MSADAGQERGALPMRRGNISRWSIEHPYTVIAFYLGVALLAVLVIFFQMPRRMMPYVESPIVGIVSMMPGLSAEEMEIYFSKPIEERMVDLKNVHFVRSTSQEGFSIVIGGVLVRHGHEEGAVRRPVADERRPGRPAHDGRQPEAVLGAGDRPAEHPGPVPGRDGRGVRRGPAPDPGRERGGEPAEDRQGRLLGRALRRARSSRCRSSWIASDWPPTR